MALLIELVKFTHFEYIFKVLLHILLLFPFNIASQFLFKVIIGYHIFDLLFIILFQIILLILKLPALLNY